MQAFFQKHHKPYYGRSSGKGSRKGKHNNQQGKTQAQQDTTKLYFGKFRVKNPTGKDGKPLTCFNCGSDTHLKKDCKAPPKQDKGYHYVQPQITFTNMETSLFQHQPTQAQPMQVDETPSFYQPAPVQPTNEQPEKHVHFDETPAFYQPLGSINPPPGLPQPQPQASNAPLNLYSNEADPLTDLVYNLTNGAAPPIYTYTFMVHHDSHTVTNID